MNKTLPFWRLISWWHPIPWAGSVRVEVRWLVILGTLWIGFDSAVVKAADGHGGGVIRLDLSEADGRGDAVLLSAGDMRMPTGRVSSMENDLKEQAAFWQAELMDLSQPPSARAADDRPASTDDEEVLSQNKKGARPNGDLPVKERLSDLYDTAEAHMERGAYGAAAKALERLIRKVPRSTRADTARLELARIYTTQLDRPERAVFHLQAYLERHRAGRKSKLVRKRLCRIAKEKGIGVETPCR